MPVLEVMDLSIRFGGLQALNSLSIVVDEWLDNDANRLETY